MYALALIDLQNAFCHPDGSFARRGFSLSGAEEMLGNVEKLVSFFAKIRWPIVCTQLEFAPDYSDSGLLVSHLYPTIRELGAYVRGTFDAQLLAEVEAILPQDCLHISKTRYDPFLGSDLAAKAKLIGIRHFIVAGVLTNVCVEAFVRSAFDRDFLVTTVSDATCTYFQGAHAASLATIAQHFGEVRESIDVIKQLSQ